ncbi:MAG TPA: SdrD B-like domain-containing protein [Candidatus Krumholzibacteria bacterium]
MKRNHATRGFTLVEIAVGIVLIGLVLLAFAGMTSVVQKSAGKTRQYADAQQNARAALDFMTGQLRSAGSDVAAYDGQLTIVHAGPEQVGFNGDIDGGQTIDGEKPMTAVEKDYAVPPSGTAIYTAPKTYSSGAETVVFTLDSDQSGVVDDSDQGDDDEEQGKNPHLYVLRQYRYGVVDGNNEERDADIALVRGPVKYDNGDMPPPLFEYYYDDDNDLATPDKLWGDDDGNLVLNSAEIEGLTDMPANLLYGIRMIKVNVVAEGTAISEKSNEGFANVVMSSRVYIRNADSQDSAHIYGTVFLDANANGVKDSGESGVPNVKLTASPLGRKTQTDQFGQYSIPVDAGSYTIKETLPTGWTATTSASVNVSINDGETYLLNFGAKNGDKFGYVVGTVWDDINKNAMNDGEDGIPDVVVQLDNGMAAKTNLNGYFRITAPLGSYVVSETDPTGYSSTTANSFPASLVNDGDSVVVHFGDAIGGTEGTLEGYVYIDEDKNAVRGGSEKGLAGVTLTLSTGQATTTDAGGFYTFSLQPGKYDIYQLDLDGYTSTTPNIVYGIVIDTGVTVNQDFGDILLKDLSFVEVAIGDTQRPLSVSVGDMREDTKDDPDIVLGTPAPTNNLFIWTNNYVDGSTPLTSLFNKNPNSMHKASTDVNAVKFIEHSGDGYLDVITGQESSGNNLMVWNNDPVQHDVGKNPNQIISSGLSCATTRFRMSDLDGDGMRDLLVGLKSKVATFAGGFDVRLALGGGSFASQSVITTTAKGTTLGVVSCFGLGDLDRDGRRDLVVGSNNGPYWGYLDIYHGDGKGNFTWAKRLLAKAAVNDVTVVDVVDDGDSRPDLLVAVSEAKNVGGMQVWLNKKGVYGVDDQTGFTYDSETDPKVPDRYMTVGGEALAINNANLDGDIYPDVVIGTRTSSFYTGDLLIVQAIGSKSEQVSNVKVNVAGEVVTLELGDMNKDSNTDVVVTTRTSNSAGKLAIYFLNGPSILP